jgi:hypothetical protein
LYITAILQIAHAMVEGAMNTTNIRKFVVGLPGIVAVACSTDEARQTSMSPTEHSRCTAAPSRKRSGLWATLSHLFTSTLAAVALLWPAPPAGAQFISGRFVSGNDAVGAASQGWSVALSGDGSTALVGGPGDNSGIGAAWAFLYNSNGGGGVNWFQQGTKLEGGNNTGAASEGTVVALSADGNTAIVGGFNDNNRHGAAWVFTRSAGVWTQQGPKLVGSATVGTEIDLGEAVALSADGNTAIVGGPGDASGVGAAWVYTRSNGVWTQQGPKLVASDATGNAGQGSAVALSSDGNTALVGGWYDNNLAGAVFVWTRSGGIWSEQTKLVGSGAVNVPIGATQGTTVALSADGNTAILGGPYDNDHKGAVWVFTRSAGQWTQQGGKLVAASGPPLAYQGSSLALSGDGNTALVNGPPNSVSASVWTRNNGVWTNSSLIDIGAGGGSSVALSSDGTVAMLGNYTDGAWTLMQPPYKLDPAATHDFNGDYQSDIVWRHSGGTVAAWLMNGAQVLQSAGFGVVPTNWQIVGQRDFNNDGMYDWLWRDANTGTVAIWLLNTSMTGLSVLQSGSLGAVPGNWQVAGTSDFNYDGKGDILWRDMNTGTVAIWLMNGVQVMQVNSLGAVPLNWQIVGTDAHGNIFWRDNNTGTVVVWEVYGSEVLQSVNFGAVPGNWAILGIGDFDGNGSADVLWRDTNTGTVAVWLMNGLQFMQSGVLGAVPLNWQVAQTGDYAFIGRSEILWYDSNTGTAARWVMDRTGLQVANALIIATVGTDWTIQGLNAD